MKNIETTDFTSWQTGQIKISELLRKFALGFVALACLAFAGCSKDAEINSFLNEWETVTNEIVSKVDANPSATGVEDAQKTWEARKVALKAKWDNVKNARGFQVSSDTQKKMEESAKKNVSALTAVMSKNVVKLATDKSAADKFQKLLEDYGNTFKM